MKPHKKDPTRDENGNFRFKGDLAGIAFGAGLGLIFGYQAESVIPGLGIGLILGSLGIFDFEKYPW